MKGCLGILVLFVVLALAEYWALGYTPLSGSIGLPLVSAGTITIATASLWGTWLAIRRQRALSVSPDRWRDGAFVGFTGQITGQGTPLVAPGSGAAVAAYEYSLKATRRNADDSSDVTAFHGMGMAGPSVTAATQTFRLIGFPILSSVPKTVLTDESSRERIAKHLLRAEVQPKPKTLGGMFRSLNDALADRDGHVAVDEGAYAEFDLGPYRDRSRSDFEGAADALAAHLAREGFFVEESLVPEGAEVSIFGAYRAADRSIDVGSGLQNLERGLRLGSPGKSGRGELVQSLITLAVLLGIAVPLHRWIVPPLAASRTAARYGGHGIGFDSVIGTLFGGSGNRSLTGLAQDEDAAAIRLLTRLGANPDAGDPRPLQQARELATLNALLDGGASPNFSGHQGNSPLHYATERGDLAAVALLLARGAHVDPVDDWGNTPLMRAAVYGHLEIGRALLAAGADANHRAKDGSAALDEARANGHADFAELLKTKGEAHETEITAATGKAVGVGDPQVRVLQAYEDALFGHDGATLGQLKPALRGYDWSGTDWNALLSSRPVRITEVQGFSATDRATLRVNGPTSDGRSRGLTLGFELHRESVSATNPLARYDGWRIEREWIEWGEVTGGR